jgi:hypothetical protein
MCFEVEQVMIGSLAEPVKTGFLVDSELTQLAEAPTMTLLMPAMVTTS